MSIAKSFHSQDSGQPDPGALPAENSDSSTQTVLIVDDSALIRSWLESLLTETVDVITAADGQDGIEQTKKHRPDLIISDITMPQMDGIEFCAALRADQSLGRIPFIVLTSAEDSEQRILALEAGADDFINKGCDEHELRCRVKNMLALVRQQRNLEIALTKLYQKDKLITEDLKAARAFQEAILPLPLEHPEIEIQSYFKPADMVGGDIYDIHPIGEGVRVFLADITGHGVQASLRTMVVMDCYRQIRKLSGPERVLSALNALILERHQRTMLRFAACCLDLFPAPDGLRVFYADAGMPPAFFVSSDNDTHCELYNGGPFVAMLPGIKYEKSEHLLTGSGALVCATDGVTEETIDGELGESLLKRILYKEGYTVGVHQLRRILSQQHIDDDCTALFIRRK